MCFNKRLISPHNFSTLSLQCNIVPSENSESTCNRKERGARKTISPKVQRELAEIPNTGHPNLPSWIIVLPFILFLITVVGYSPQQPIPMLKLQNQVLRDKTNNTSFGIHLCTLLNHSLTYMSFLTFMCLLIFPILLNSSQDFLPTYPAVHFLF